MLTKAKLVLIDPAVALSHLDVDAICAALTEAFQDTNHGFTSFARQAAFIGQLCVESAHFSRLTENLNYSAEGLLKTFPKYFSNVIVANNYSHQPEKIANRVYANRMGNGDEASGDGWRFRGRGLIQLTGRDNYTAFGAANNVDDLTLPKGAVDSAVWFYTVKHNLNPLADTGNITAITKAINGGTTALDERIKFYNSARDVLPL